MADDNSSPVIRIPLKINYEARRGQTNKDSFMLNFFPEPYDGNSFYAVKRPGTEVVTTFTAGVGSGTYNWQGYQWTVVGTTLYQNTTAIATIIGSGGNYFFAHNLANTVLVIKNGLIMYTVTTGGSVTAVTDVNYPALTVPGLVYLDGTFYVMDVDGNIRGSDIEDPTTWNPLNSIALTVNPGIPQVLAKQLNFLLAFSDRECEVFYDAGNATGSPLLPYQPSYIPLGTAVGNSVASIEANVFWISQSEKAGPCVYTTLSLQPQKISTGFVDQLLEADGLSNVGSFCVRVRGGGFYVLVLRTSGVTLVFHMETGTWHRWSLLTAEAPQTITNLVWAYNQVTATIPGHGFVDGEVVTVSGASPSGYNGSFVVSYVDTNTVTYPVFATLSAYSGSPQAVGYTESYFPFMYYSNDSGINLLQHESNGTLVLMAENLFQDSGLPIHSLVQTEQLDQGNNYRKFVGTLDVIGDQNPTVGYLCYSDNDFQTYSSYRAANMNAQTVRFTKNGSARRRAWQFAHVDNTDCRIALLEISGNQGMS